MGAPTHFNPSQTLWLVISQEGLVEIQMNGRMLSGSSPNFRVTEMSKDNCMDSKNLAICWWPTLLQYEFGDLGKFEAMRPHLEDIVQTMIDQFRFLFCGQEEVMMV